MNRRTFFKAILAIPFALGLLPTWLEAKLTIDADDPILCGEPDSIVVQKYFDAMDTEIYPGAKKFKGFHWHPDGPEVRNHWVPNDPQRLKFDEKLWKQHDDYLYHFYRSIARSKILPYTRLEP